MTSRHRRMSFTGSTHTSSAFGATGEWYRRRTSSSSASVNPPGTGPSCSGSAQMEYVPGTPAAARVIVTDVPFATCRYRRDGFERMDGPSVPAESAMDHLRRDPDYDLSA